MIQLCFGWIIRPVHVKFAHTHLLATVSTCFYSTCTMVTPHMLYLISRPILQIKGSCDG